MINLFLEIAREEGVAALIATHNMALARRLTREGGALDPTPDLYDLALVLFGFAWFHRATKDKLARDWMHRTLDFIETDQGPVLLEAGPGITPLGGGHPCAFAGIMNPRLGDIPNLSGVAFRTMPHVVLGEPGRRPYLLEHLPDIAGPDNRARRSGWNSSQAQGLLGVDVVGRLTERQRLARLGLPIVEPVPALVPLSSPAAWVMTVSRKVVMVFSGGACVEKVP